MGAVAHQPRRHGMIARFRHARPATRLPGFGRTARPSCREGPLLVLFNALLFRPAEIGFVGFDDLAFAAHGAGMPLGAHGIAQAVHMNQADRR